MFGFVSLPGAAPGVYGAIVCSWAENGASGFAGHGGPNAAEFVEKTLFDCLMRNHKFSSDLSTAVGKYLLLSNHLLHCQAR